MRIFLTGATGFIGAKIIPELINAGHQVLGLARSDAGAQMLIEAGAAVYRGDIVDLNSLRAGAAKCDGVIHTAFDHNFQNYVANCDKDHGVIMALGEVLQGSERPLVITSATLMGIAAPDQLAVEDYFNPQHPNPRKASELAAWELLQRGINVSAVRLSQIHDAKKQGLVTNMITLAREKGFSAYVGEGLNCWSAAHVSDTSRLYRLALEKAHAGARYHATAEERIAFKNIAETIGKRLAIPVRSLLKDEAPGHFGWLSMFADKDMSATSATTRELLQWHPTGPGLLESIR